MIIFQGGDGTWCAFEKGPLRPIVGDGDTRREARVNCTYQIQSQAAEEYAYSESMSSRALEGMPGGEDLG